MHGRNNDPGIVELHVRRRRRANDRGFHIKQSRGDFRPELAVFLRLERQPHRDDHQQCVDQLHEQRPRRVHPGRCDQLFLRRQRQLDLPVKQLRRDQLYLQRRRAARRHPESRRKRKHNLHLWRPRQSLFVDPERPADPVRSSTLAGWGTSSASTTDERRSDRHVQLRLGAGAAPRLPRRPQATISSTRWDRQPI